MEILKFDKSKKYGSFKILNATNGGPWHKRHANDQYRSNLEEYKAARIPYSRNHDSALVTVYGGPYAHDITMIFPNFDADVNDPASYDFACTDESILTNLDAGTETFFRLGQTIEHQIKKHGTIPPADFDKWSQICEHIIMHYNEGWADGFNLNIKYWEIWNEPDLDEYSETHKRTWGGTREQFFALYEITSKRLKNRFPNLKIGGPAIAGNVEWGENFIKEMHKRNAPLDFFSWHIYCTEPAKLIKKAKEIRAHLDENGYTDTETNLNEWNYVKGWEEEYTYSLLAIHGIKGASFVMSCISEAQKTDALDMMMYYDTRPSVFCGVFDHLTAKPLKGYYPLKWYGMFYDMKNEIRCDSSPENIYTLCGVDENDKALAVITHYSDDDSAAPKDVKIEFSNKGTYEVYLLDKDNDATLIKTTDDLTLTMDIHSCILIKEV